MEQVHDYDISKELIDMTEIIRLFDCKEDRVVRMLRAGELPGVKLGRDWRIPRAAFWQRVNEMALESAAERRASMQPAPVAEPPALPRRPGRPRLR